MAFVKNDDMANTFKIGDHAVTNREIECFVGKFEKGTKVKVTEIDPSKGYTLEDEYGNRIRETGFDSIESLNE